VPVNGFITIYPCLQKCCLLSGEAAQLYRFDHPWAMIAVDFKLMACFFVGLFGLKVSIEK
jgi:hypothetical protein